jgi:cold shock CspA family protein
MNGTIKSLDEGDATGLIAAEDGRTVEFCPADVLAYDVPSLAVGQVVSFELEAGRKPKALHVVVQRMRQPAGLREKRGGAAELRYLGFEQQENIRRYHFEHVVPGEQKAAFTVQADLELFTRRHLNLQIGPALCLRLLGERLNEEPAQTPGPSVFTLTDRDLAAYQASLPAPKVRHGFKRSAAAAASPQAR